MTDKLLKAFGKPSFAKRHGLMKSNILSCTLKDMPASTKQQFAAIDKTMPTIVVLYYGGTIGMVHDDKGFLIPSNDRDRLLQPLEMKGLSSKVQVVWYPVYDKAIDSTNARWVHWVTIGNAIKNLYDHVDGFVICGGTDTMAHLSAAMNFMFPNIGKPIIVTGAQLPMIELGDDGTGNLWFSLLCAASNLSGCHLVFGDELMHGLKVHKVQDRRLRAFTCPTRWQLGHFDGAFERYPHAPHRNPVVTGSNLKFIPCFCEGVKVTSLSPGTASDELLYDASSPLTQVLLLKSYGAGNTRDERIIKQERSHVECLRIMYDNEFPVVLGSPMMDGRVESPYIAGAMSVSTEDGGGGAISGGDTTGPALEVKCMHVLAQSWSSEHGLDYTAFRNGMHRNWVGELSVD